MLNLYKTLFAPKSQTKSAQKNSTKTNLDDFKIKIKPQLNFHLFHRLTDKLNRNYKEWNQSVKKITMLYLIIVYEEILCEL